MCRRINIKEKLASLIPRNPFLYRVCKRYVDRYNSENNDSIHTNGELRLMQTVLPQCKTVFDVGANKGQFLSVA